MNRIILGLGKTGLSIAQHFLKRDLFFKVMDTRTAPPFLDSFKKRYTHIPIYLGGLNAQWIQEAHEIFISPGLHPKSYASIRKINSRVKLCSDLDLFDQIVNAPVIGITGTNGKSTVTTLITQCLKAAHKSVSAGGNLGTPALDLLKKTPPDFYVLELSSFQLEITKNIRLHTAVLLNISPDHLDRHSTLIQYQKIKQKIYRNCQYAIWNREDSATYPSYAVKKLISFGIKAQANAFNLQKKGEDIWLSEGKQLLLNVNKLKIKGQHNWLNTLAVLAIQKAVGISLTQTISALTKFEGLPHNTEKIVEKSGVVWINDSKATNVHASLAAFASFKQEQSKRIIAIMGGLDKNISYQALCEPLKKYTKHLILIGSTMQFMKKIFHHIVPISEAIDLKEAVNLASKYAKQGDIVLLSPACASQDMFKNYIERGNCFKEQVKLLLC